MGIFCYLCMQLAKVTYIMTWRMLGAWIAALWLLN